MGILPVRKNIDNVVCSVFSILFNIIIIEKSMGGEKLGIELIYKLE